MQEKLEEEKTTRPDRIHRAASRLAVRPWKAALVIIPVFLAAGAMVDQGAGQGTGVVPNAMLWPLPPRMNTSSVESPRIAVAGEAAVTVAEIAVAGALTAAIETTAAEQGDLDLDMPEPICQTLATFETSPQRCARDGTAGKPGLRVPPWIIRLGPKLRAWTIRLRRRRSPEPRGLGRVHVRSPADPTRQLTTVGAAARAVRWQQSAERNERRRVLQPRRSENVHEAFCLEFIGQ